MASKFLPLCVYLSIYLIIRFSKFFMAVDVPLRLLVGMQPTHYFIRSDPCHLTLPLFVTLEEFFESVSIKWLVQTAFLLSFRTLFPISNRSYLIWVKSGNHVHIVLVHFFPQIWETLVKGSRQLAPWFFCEAVGWSFHVLQTSSPSYMRRQSSSLMPSLFHAYHL